MAQQQRFTGTVLWFNGTKGYGFIKPSDGSNDVFVHQSSIRSVGFRSLAEGEEVEFSISSEPGGKSSAVDVTGPNGASVRGSSTSDSQGTGSVGGRGGFGRDWSGGRDRYGYRGPVGGSGGGCFTCGEVGHLSRECPRSRSSRGGGGSNGACFRCGRSGHVARDCNHSTNGGSGGRGGGQSCFNCGGYGHMARDCTSKRSHGDSGNSMVNLGGPCYSCSKPGHIARDCPERPGSPSQPTTSCFHCGEKGHYARECPN